MIDYQLLEELVTFQETGTLSATAEKLLITQPSVTRGMQKLEDELGVSLFDRTVNRLKLNSTGELAAKLARKALAANQDFVTVTQNYARQQDAFTIASIAPGPLLLLDYLQTQNDNLTNIVLKPVMSVTEVKESLLSAESQLAFITDPLDSDYIIEEPIGIEQLYLSISTFHALASYPKVTFDDLADMSFILSDDIGIWHDIIQNAIPNLHPLVQNSEEAIQQLTSFSDFPAFNSNITQLTSNRNTDNRKSVLIDDDRARMKFFAAYVNEQADRVKPIIELMKALWPTKNN